MSSHGLCAGHWCRSRDHKVEYEQTSQRFKFIEFCEDRMRELLQRRENLISSMKQSFEESS